MQCLQGHNKQHDEHATDAVKIRTYEYNQGICTEWQQMCDWNLAGMSAKLLWNGPKFQRSMSILRSSCVWDLVWSYVNSLRPSNTVWQQRTGSTLAQVKACCLTALGHCLNQCLFIASGIHLRALSWEDMKIPPTEARLKIAFLKSHSRLPGTNVLTHLPPGQNGHHFAADSLKHIFMNEKFFYFGFDFTKLCSQGSNWQ